MTPESGRDEPADQVDERGLPRAVGADEGKHLALRHGEVHVVHGVGVAEVLGQLVRPQDAHEAGAALPRRRASRIAVPTIPAGSASTRTTSTMPRTICQYTVCPTA